MRSQLRYPLLLIAYFVALSSTGRSCFAGPAASNTSSPLASTMATPNCSSYISAYGVSPAQSQRIDSNWKKFQGICPAPSPAYVDFVVIFTHDVDFYDYTMPVQVHTDSSGLSDWTAIVLLDSTQPSAKYKREYVWVFRLRRGNYDPGHFSRNAKADYSGVESGLHNSDRAVDAAFKFIAGQKT